MHDEVVLLSSAEPPLRIDRWFRATGRHPSPAPVLVGGFGRSRTQTAELATISARFVGAALLPHRTRSDHTNGPQVAVGVKSLPDDAAIVTAAAQRAAMDAGLVVLHAVPASFAERSVGLDAALDRGHALLTHAKQIAHDAAPDVAVAVRPVRALLHEIVDERVDADLLVLGGLRPAADGTLGQVALSALHHAPCSMLLVARNRRN